MFEQDIDEKKLNETTLKHINGLLEIALKGHPTDDVNKYFRYYSGKFNKSKDYSVNQRNVIKGIVEAKTTLVLDGQIATSIVPKVHTFSSLQRINDLELEASVIDEAVKHVFSFNNDDNLRQKCTRNSCIAGFGVLETVWDTEANFGLGDIKINQIEPTCFFPDPSAKSVEECNYIFIKESWSVITLKSKYPQYADKIKALINNGKDNNDLKDKRKPNSNIQAVTAGSNTTFAQGYEKKSDISENSKNITVWKCYLKDDTTWVTEKVDSDNKSDEEQMKIEAVSSKYPNGRVIIFVDGAKDWILEDKEIDYPFGFPIDVFNWVDSDNIFGLGDVADLVEIQDRVNGTYLKLREIIRNSNNWIWNDIRSGLTSDDYVNSGILTPDNPQFIAQTFDNMQYDDLKELIEAARMYKTDAMEISRVNESIVSGVKPKGVTSGKQLEELNESPMSSIRAVQRNYKTFIISVTKKIIALIQKYYNIQRLIKLSDGEEFVLMTPRDEAGVQELTFYRKSIPPMPEQQEQAIEPTEQNFEPYKTIKTNFLINQYDVEVIAGTEIPRSPQEKANLTSQLFDRGMLPQGLAGVKIFLNDIDYPNRYAIFQELEKQEEENLKNKPPMPPADKINSIFKDMPAWAQLQWLESNGFTPPEVAGQGIKNPSLPLNEQPPDLIQNKGEKNV